MDKTVIVLKDRKEGSSKAMHDMIVPFMGKDVVIILVSEYGGPVVGKICQIQDDWLRVEREDGQFEIVKIDYIARIVEHPVDKKGKKRMIIGRF